jgi:hypothetical protein
MKIAQLPTSPEPEDLGIEPPRPLNEGDLKAETLVFQGTGFGRGRKGAKCILADVYGYELALIEAAAKVHERCPKHPLRVTIPRLGGAKVILDGVICRPADMWWIVCRSQHVMIGVSHAESYTWSVWTTLEHIAAAWRGGGTAAHAIWESPRFLKEYSTRMHRLLLAAC